MHGTTLLSYCDEEKKYNLLMGPYLSEKTHNLESHLIPARCISFFSSKVVSKLYPEGNVHVVKTVH
jgi:hypothetical protein